MQQRAPLSSLSIISHLLFVFLLLWCITRPNSSLLIVLPFFSFFFSSRHLFSAVSGNFWQFLTRFCLCHYRNLMTDTQWWFLANLIIRFFLFQVQILTTAIFACLLFQWTLFSYLFISCLQCYNYSFLYFE